MSDNPFDDVFRANLSPSPNKKSEEANEPSEPEGYETAPEDPPYGTPEGTQEGTPEGTPEKIEVVVKKSP